jgi:predicted ATPase
MQAALDALREQLDREDVRLEVAIGVNTGEVVAGDASLGQRLVTGDAVNVAARLEQAAPSGGILIGELTYQLVRDAADVEEVEPLTLKGKAEPVPAYRLLGVRSGEAFARRQDTPMVGREQEMALLRATLRAAVEAQDCRMVTVVGDAGVGKTRLTREFLDSVGSHARVLQGRCLPYGDGITFWPIVEVAREAADIREGDPPEAARARLAGAIGPANADIADRVASAIGLLDEQFPVSELFFGIRRFLEVLAADEPVVVLFDDIHWAEATFLDLIGYLTESTRGAPVLLLCTARHELLEAHADWAEAPHQDRILLTRLSDADAGMVVENLLGRVGLSETIRAKVVGAAEGNPLFVEQLLSMLIDSGALRFRGGQWSPSGDLSDISIPPTIHALLAARLDQLPTEERSVVEPASVIGLNFPQSAVAELVPGELREVVPIHLDTLTNRQLVRPADAQDSPDATYRFHHILVRDAAYQGLLKRTRADYHVRFVQWADRVNAAAGRSTEFEEILGYHLEQAYRYRTELGPLDEHGRAVGNDASGRLASAGRRAMARGDMPAAAGLLKRAAALLPDAVPTRAILLRDAAEALMELGDFAGAQEALSSAAADASALGDRVLQTTIELMDLHLRYSTDAGDADTDVVATVELALPILEAAHDRGGLARGWRLLSQVGAATGRYVFMEHAAEEAIKHARRAGDRLIETRARSTLAMGALLGQTPVPLAIDRCESLLLQAEGDRKAESLILAVLAHLEAMRGRFDRARDLYGRSRSTLEELGVRQLEALTSLDSGWVEMIAGDPVAAERELRSDFDKLQAMGERNYISTTAAYLAEAIYRQARYDEAAAMTQFSEEVAAHDDVSTQFMWRAVRGKVLARRGQFDEGERLAREGLRLIKESDDLDSQGKALMSLAEVLALAGREDAAEGVAAEAIQVWERKGDIVSAGQARAFARTFGVDARAAAT